MSDIDELKKRVAALEAIVAQVKAAFGGAAALNASAVADDADLDGRYGDEEIRKDPSTKYWEGESFVGRTMSQTSPAYLDAVAKWRSASAFMKRKDPNADEQQKKYAGYDEKTAARARGWAARLRAGYKAKPVAPAYPAALDEVASYDLNDPAEGIF